MTGSSYKYFTFVIHATKLVLLETLGLHHQQFVFSVTKPSLDYLRGTTKNISIDECYYKILMITGFSQSSSSASIIVNDIGHKQGFYGVRSESEHAKFHIEPITFLYRLMRKSNNSLVKPRCQ
jgi:hypothetical protein